MDPLSAVEVITMEETIVVFDLHDRWFCRWIVHQGVARGRCAIGRLSMAIQSAQLGQQAPGVAAQKALWDVWDVWDGWDSSTRRFLASSWTGSMHAACHDRWKGLGNMSVAMQGGY